MTDLELIQDVERRLSRIAQKHHLPKFHLQRFGRGKYQFLSEDERGGVHPVSPAGTPKELQFWFFGLYQGIKAAAT